MFKLLVCLVLLAVVTAHPYPYEEEELVRIRRSQQDGGWSVNPNIGRDQTGNTRGQVEVNHKGENHDLNAGWGKVIRGPDRAKPTWHVGGSIRW